METQTLSEWKWPRWCAEHRDWQPCSECAEEQLGMLKAENERLKAALKEIKDEQGKVCPDFESCAHDSCKSSYTSWAIADAALKATKLSEEEKKDEREG